IRSRARHNWRSDSADRPSPTKTCRTSAAAALPMNARPAAIRSPRSARSARGATWSRAYASRRAASSACPRSKNGRSSTSVELGRSLGDERGVELAEVSRLHAERLPLRFRFDGGGEVQIELRIKKLFRHPDGNGGPV